MRDYKNKIRSRRIQSRTRTRKKIRKRKITQGLEGKCEQKSKTRRGIRTKRDI